MKTAGIVADNYKVEKFKKELSASGFNDIQVVPFINNTSNIKVKYLDSQLEKLTNVCKAVETYFKARKN